MDHLCYLCLVFVMLSCLLIAALWSPEGKGLASWLLFVMFIVILLLSHLVSCDRCGALLYRFLILAVFLTLTVSNFIGNLIGLKRVNKTAVSAWNYRSSIFKLLLFVLPD